MAINFNNLEEQSNRVSDSSCRAQAFNRNIIKDTAIYGAIVGATIMLVPELALAAFDLDAGGKAFADPLIKFFNDYYPIGIVGMGAGGSLVAQGDLRTKAFGFGGGCLLGGLIVGAVKVGMGI